VVNVGCVDTLPGLMEIQGAGALVAGGASGLGAATARALAEAGAEVVVADLNTEKGEALAAEIGAGFVEVDVTDPEAVGGAVERAASAPGACGSRSAAPGSAGPSGSPTKAAPTTSNTSPTSSRST
jgi:NAD(P)-dependent dehydrogenase (short-subunit alcohol dehydrogenase family)